jgi:hypothetical protein
MSTRAILLGLLLPCAVAAPAPTAALAGSFSAPVRLPTKFAEWRFAVNDRREAVGVYGSEEGIVVVQLGRSGELRRSWLLQVPPHVGYPFASVALGERGKIAVGVSYNDGQLKDSEEPHGPPGCCQRIAISSWRLGQSPPAAQAVSPTLNAANALYGQPFEAPLMVVGGSTVTALWTRGGTGPLEPFAPQDETGEAQIEEAFGQLGAPLHKAKLLTVPNGVRFPDLHLAPSGRAVASWVDDAEIIRTVTGLRSGALRRSIHFQQIHGLCTSFPEVCPGIGFTHDDQGATVFAYLSGPEEGAERLMTMTSTSGARFTRPRAIASIPPKSSEISLYAGGRRALLAIFNHKPGENQHLEALRGSVFADLGAPAQVDETPYSDNKLNGFVDSRGRSVIVHPAPVPNHPTEFELVAFSAQSDRPFGATQRIAPALANYGLGGAAEPIATSPHGDAVFDVTDDEEGEQRRRQYLIRYTP